MKAFKTIFITVVIIIILSFILVPTLLIKGGKKIDSEIKDLKSYVGKNVVIKEDTLMIMKLSVINNAYVLEDGREISIDLVKNKKVQILN